MVYLLCIKNLPVLLKIVKIICIILKCIKNTDVMIIVGENMIQLKKLFEFIKNEIVVVLSFLLALISAFFVAPSEKYIEYIDFRTISLLFCLMLIMAGLNALGVFKILAHKLLKRVKNMVHLVLTFVLLCFFSSMIITNDVALITFIPFTIITLNMAGLQGKLIYVVVLETIAANLGSMLTPIGNPQNLYLVSAFNIGIADFVKTIFPYALLSLLLLIIASLFSGKATVKFDDDFKIEKPDFKLTMLYCILFLCALLCVFRFVHFWILLVIVVVSVLIFNRKVFLKVDYSLLFTFIFLFIFIGNLGSIQSISDFLYNIVAGNEVITGIIASQIISNVPAAILLSGFTDNINALLIGVNIGGLGTLIASMASLISFRFIQQEKINNRKYLFIFTVMNIAFLASNMILYFIITVR